MDGCIREMKIGVWDLGARLNVRGVEQPLVVSYKEDGALIQELFSFDGIGTQIVTVNTEQVRQAQIDDIGGIFDLIRPLEEQGILVRRSREQLEQEINNR